MVLVTTLGLAAFFTPLKTAWEEPGASRVRTVALYLLVTTIGARGDLKAIVEAPLFLAAGALWITVDVALLALVAR